MKYTKKHLRALKKDVVAHWKRMIVWAKKQPKRVVANAWIMQSNLGKWWGSSDCAFCLALSCEDCPFVIYFGRVCTLMGHIEVAGSKTWGEWVKNAEEFLEKIKAIKI